jgi:hypothetical protein
MVVARVNQRRSNMPDSVLAHFGRAHLKKVIQVAVDSSAYYQHVFGSYFANITTLFSSRVAIIASLWLSWILEPAHALMMDATHANWYA